MAATVTDDYTTVDAFDNTTNKVQDDTVVGSTGSTSTTFKVEGTGATSIRIGGSASGNGTWVQNTGGLLDILIDGTATGVTKTEVVGADGDVTFDVNSFLNVDFAGATNLGTFVVMEWSGDVLVDNLAFAPGVDESIWSFNVDEVNKQLTVTAIPEPATLLLVGISGLGIYASRRFRT